jgi:hypothetical protein
MSTSRRSARLQELPSAESSYLNTLTDVDLLKRVAALFEKGWTLAAIGQAFTPPKGRSTVKSWVDRSHQYSHPHPHLTLEKPVPSPKHKTDPKGYQRLTPKSPGVPADITERLQELAPLAKGFRARMSSSTQEARANKEMDTIVQNLRVHDVSIADIARAAQVTHRAIAKRIEKLNLT